MKSTKRTLYRVLLVALAFLSIIGLGMLISGQEAPTLRVGLPDDWTHHHVVFSNPGTAAEALAQGRVAQWYRIVNDPRYILQQMKRNPAQRVLAAPVDLATRMDILRDDAVVHLGPPSSQKKLMKKDWNVDLGPSGTVGAGNYPAKYSFNSATSCSDLAVFNTSLAGVAGTSGQATVMGLTNLYSSHTPSCGTTIPSVAWAYNTTTSDKVVTSVVFSLTGKQIAFISSDGSSHAYLNVLQFASGQGSAYSSPVTPTSNTYATGANYSTCKTNNPTGTCLLRLEFANGDNDTTSSPYYDYGSDTLWVGDADGDVHKFTAVFNGSPAESVTGTSTPWASVGTSTALTSPVYDGSNYVYVGGANGILYSISSTPTVTHTGTLAGGLGITDAPLLDLTSPSSDSYLYVTVGDDNTSPTFFAAAWQITPGAFTGGTGAEFKLGHGTNDVYTYAGTFDNNHYLNGGTTGNFYACFTQDETGGTTATYLLYSALSSFTTISGTHSLQVATTGNAAPCSAVTEAFDGTHDYLYLSVGSHGIFTSTTSTCTTAADGCVFSFNIGTGTTAGFSYPSANTGSYQVLGSTITSSTSGIVVDYPGSANYTYFTPNTTGTGSPCTTTPTTHGCAVQLQQN
jgi:hypothetical protein